MVETVVFAPEHAVGVSEVCCEQGWPTYADPSMALRGCTAPGACVAVALEGDVVVGFAQLEHHRVASGAASMSDVTRCDQRTGRELNRLNVPLVASAA